MSHKDGYALNYDQIERQTTLGRYAINQAAQQLSDLGWIRVDRPKVAGRFVAKSWTVLDPSSANQSSADDSTMEQPPVGQSTDIRRTPLREDKELRTTVQDKLEPDDFKVFWESYPRREGKLEARKAFKQALKLTDLATILAGVYRYRDDPNRSQSFTKLPATWLNKGCWDDEPLPERAATFDDRKMAADEIAQRQSEASRRAANEALQEAENAKARAAADPARVCEHNRVLVICPICNKKTLN
jgi:hypothetical protein